MKDGWHKIQGYLVFVEDGIVKRGRTEGWNAVATWPYRTSRTSSGWWLDDTMTVSAFSARVRRGTAMMT